MNGRNLTLLPQWQPSPRQMTLTEPDLHVWRAALDVSTARVEQLWGLLSEEEQARALRFKFAHHRRRFTVARSTLRLILSRYIAEATDKISFTYNAFGKPALNNRAMPDLQFNASDSHEMALYAVNLNAPMGIDIEYVQKHIEAEAIAERFFSDQEIMELKALSAAQKISAFFNIWTRKEAFIKAIGLGLSYPLKDFDVSVGEPATLLAVRSGGHRAEEWSTSTLQPDEDYIGAVTVKSLTKKLKLWDFTE